MRKKRVLIVDDDPDFSAMIGRALERGGYQPACANSTDGAALLSRCDGFDAVLLDLILGQENGWETLRALRAQSDVPVLLMTGAGVDSEMGRDAEKLGAQGILQKPFAVEEFLKRLSELTETGS